MGLEAATFISQLVATNPIAGDKKNQGDDHFRLLKAVLQANFPNADRAFRFPEVAGKNANYSIVEADDNKTIVCDTTATFNLTLPTPTYDGWCVRVIKTTFDLNPVYVLPPSGTISTQVGNLAKVRVNVPTVEQTFFWTGAQFIKLAGSGESAAGFLFDCGGAVPVGYEAAIGQSLVRLDYPETFSIWGTLYGAPSGTTFSAPNMIDQFAVGAGSTYALGARAGSATHTLVQANLPNYALPNTLGLNDPGHEHVKTKGVVTPPAGGGAPVPTFADGANAWGSGFNTTGVTITGGVTLGGSSVPISHVPPYLAVNKIFRKC